MALSFETIGRIKTPYHEPRGMPIQAQLSPATARVEVFRRYREGLMDLDGFERIWLIFGFHQSTSWSSVVTPFLDDKPHGVFATRAPSRPCPIGMRKERHANFR